MADQNKFDALDQELLDELKVGEPVVAETETVEEFDYGQKRQEIFEEPKTAEEIEHQLEEARGEYLRAKKDYDDLLAAHKTLGIFRKKEDKGVVESRYEKTKQRYKEAREDLKPHGLKKYFEEQNRLLREEIKIKTKSSKFFERIKSGEQFLEKYHHQLDNMNWKRVVGKDRAEKIDNWLTWQKTDSRWKKAGLFAARAGLNMFNARLAISYGLMGVGIATGVGLPVGLTAMGARRALAGTSTFAGLRSYLDTRTARKDLVELGQAYHSKTAATGETPEDISKLMQDLVKIESFVILHGQKLESIDFYNTVKTRLDEIVGKKIAAGEMDIMDVDFDKLIEKGGTQVADFARQIRSKQWKNDFMAAVGGLAVGGGLLGGAVRGIWQGGKSIYGYFSGAEEVKPEVVIPSTHAPKSPEPPAAPKVEPEPTKAETPKITPSAGEVSKAPSSEVPKGVGVTEQESTAPQPSPAPGEEVEGPRGPKAETPSSSPPTEAGGEGAILHHGQETGASIEIETDGSAAISAGTRGIEGALLDLEEKDPERYRKMIQWLYDNHHAKLSGGDDSDGALIHRFVLDYAEKHGNMDPEKLNHILEGKIKINADGSLAVDEGDVKFMETPKAATETTPLPNPPHQGEGIEGGQGGQSVQHFDFSAEAKTPTPEQSIQEAISGGKSKALDWQRLLQEDMKARQELGPAGEAGPDISSLEPAANASELEQPLPKPLAAHAQEIGADQTRTIPEPPRHPDRGNVFSIDEARRIEAEKLLEQSKIDAENAREQLHDWWLEGRATRLYSQLKAGLDTSQILQNYLGDHYENFLNVELKISPPLLDSVQNMTLKQFTETYNDPSTVQGFKITFEELKKLTDENLELGPNLAQKKIKDIVVGFAQYWEILRTKKAG